MRPEAHHFEAMGTTCALFSVGQSRSRLLEVEAWIHGLAARLTRFSTDSELSRFNARAGEWVEVSLDLAAVLGHALRAAEMSMGLVNAAVLPSLLAAGYSRPLVEGSGAVALDDARPLQPLHDFLELRGRMARLAPGSGIDLGGIAKGWMADRAVERLGANALANLGGDLMAIGAGPQGEGWPVGLGGKTLMLSHHGAATSSVRRRRWGEQLHHLIDPRTGMPAHTGLEEVSVLATSGFEAEVAAKTALLLGPDLAPGYCATNALAWWLGGRDDG